MIRPFPQSTFKKTESNTPEAPQAQPPVEGQQKQTKRKVGGIWLKKDKNGNDFFSGQFGDQKFVGFTNSYKTADNNQPDYVLYVNE